MGIGFAPGEFIPLLSGLPWLYDLKRMFLTDDTVGSMTWVMSTTLQQTSWKHAAQIDGENADEDEEAIKWAAWANTLLVDMNESFASHVEQCVELLWAGFLPFEIVTKVRDGSLGKEGDSTGSRFDDGYYGLRKLPIRDPLTIMGWNWNKEGDLLSMNQVGATKPIEMWKTCLYQTFATEQNPQGRSMLQGAWKSWRLKNKISESEAIGIDRDLCGLPTFKVPESLLNDADERVSPGGDFTEAAMKAQARIASAIKAVSDMRFNRSGGLIMPSDSFAEDVDGDKTPMYDFKLVSTAGQRSIDTRTVYRDYDRSIARIAMMQFLHLGDRSTGSYGLSDDQSSMALKSLTAFANIIANEWSRKVLTLLWSINGFPTKYLPALRPDQISKEGLTAIGTFLRGLGAVDGLWAGDPIARQSAAKIAGFRTDRGAQQKLAGDAQKAAAQLTLPGITPAGGNTDENV